MMLFFSACWFAPVRSIHGGDERPVLDALQSGNAFQNGNENSFLLMEVQPFCEGDRISASAWTVVWSEGLQR